MNILHERLEYHDETSNPKEINRADDTLKRKNKNKSDTGLKETFKKIRIMAEKRSAGVVMRATRHVQNKTKDAGITHDGSGRVASASYLPWLREFSHEILEKVIQIAEK